jgi:hypothetical protein
MRGLGAGFGIGVLTLTLTSVSFAGAGQTGQSPGKAKATLASPAPRTAVVKRKAFAPTPQAVEEQAQLPSDQAQTRAWLQDAARQEPVPDERTLQMQMKESKRLQQERDRNELRRKAPQALETPRASENLSVAKDVPAKSLFPLR